MHAEKLVLPQSVLTALRLSCASWVTTFGTLTQCPRFKCWIRRKFWFRTHFLTQNSIPNYWSFSKTHSQQCRSYRCPEKTSTTLSHWSKLTICAWQSIKISVWWSKRSECSQVLSRWHGFSPPVVLFRYYAMSAASALIHYLRFGKSISFMKNCLKLEYQSKCDTMMIGNCPFANIIVQWGATCFHHSRHWNLESTRTFVPDKCDQRDTGVHIWNHWQLCHPYRAWSLAS